MSSQNTQRFVILALIITLSLSVWSNYLYSQTYRLSQEYNSKLDMAEQDLKEAILLSKEANSKLEAANRIFLETNRKLEETDKILKDTEDLLKDIKNQGIANISSISVNNETQSYSYNDEPLLTAGLNIKVVTPSRFTVYYESSLVEIAESSINFKNRTYNLVEFVRITNAQINSVNPNWNDKSKVLGTDIPQVTIWLGIRSFAFQRNGIFFTELKENTEIKINLKIQLIQAHTKLVMDHQTVSLVFKLSSEGQSSVKIIE